MQDNIQQEPSPNDGPSGENIYSQDRQIGKHTVNPIAMIFPMMAKNHLAELAEDIRRNGLQQSIWLDQENQVIDGRNRYAACLLANVEPTFRKWSGEGSLLDFVLSQNLHRRHLTVGQRSIAAARSQEFYRGEARERQLTGKDLPANLPEGVGGEWRERAAQAFGVSARSVQHAADVLATGDLALIEAVSSGDAAVSAVAEIAKAPPKKRSRVLAKGRKEVAKAASEMRKKGRKTEASAERSASEPLNAPAQPPAPGITPPGCAEPNALRRIAHDAAVALRAATVADSGLASFVTLVRAEYAAMAPESSDTLGADNRHREAMYNNCCPRALDALKNLKKPMLATTIAVRLGCPVAGVAAALDELVQLGRATKTARGAYSYRYMREAEIAHNTSSTVTTPPTV